MEDRELVGELSDEEEGLEEREGKAGVGVNVDPPMVEGEGLEVREVREEKDGEGEDVLHATLPVGEGVAVG